MDFEKDASAPAVELGDGLDAGLPEFDETEFRSDEETIEEDKQEGDGNQQETTTHNGDFDEPPSFL